MDKYCSLPLMCLLILVIAISSRAYRVKVDGATTARDLKSDKLCSQCSKCDSKKCPPSEDYPHMTAYDDTLIAAALQSDYVESSDTGVYSVPNIEGGQSADFNAYFGWKSASGSTSGYHRYKYFTFLIPKKGRIYTCFFALFSFNYFPTRFSNYMDKCSGGQRYLAVDKHGKVRLGSLISLERIGDADWKSINPPEELNHRQFRFWVSHTTGKCLTVFGDKTHKRTVGVSDCKFDGSNPFQLFAFRFHYHKAFCCCGVYNN